MESCFDFCTLFMCLYVQTTWKFFIWRDFLVVGVSLRPATRCDF